MDELVTLFAQWINKPISKSITTRLTKKAPFRRFAIKELETDVVLKHLKYVEKWRSLLASNKQITDQPRSDVPNATRSDGPE